METEETIVIQPPRKKGLKILVILMAAVIVFFTTMALLSPVMKMKAIRDEFSFKQDEKAKIDERILSDSLFLKMLKEKGYLQSRISMARTDSVYLSLNLRDSTVTLEISGVAVHTVKMSRIKISRMLGNGDEFLISSMLSSPLTIENDISSIEKEPLMVSLAPRDTSEFQPDIIPDTTDIEPVSYIFEMTHGIRICFYQEEEEDAFHTFKFDLRDRFRNAFNTIKSAITLKIPEYNPYIKIFIPRADARIIYRAIPRNGQAAVYI